MSRKELEQKVKKQDRFIKSLKQRVSTLRTDVLKNKSYLKSLNTGYERVVKEQRKYIEELKTNIPKIVYIWIMKKLGREVK